MNKVRMGLIGTGMWGRIHAEAYHLHPAAELVAVHDADQARAKAFAEEFNVSKVCGSAYELAADRGVDAVAVVTPDFAHREAALAVINEGKPLLIEKPLATTVEDANAICEAAKAKGILAMVDFHNRFNPTYDSAKKRLLDGTLGDPRFIFMRHSNTQAVPLTMLSWAARSSSLWFLGSHSTDLVRWLFGCEAVEVYGACSYGVLRAKGLDVPDVWSYIIKFQNGGMATVENAWILPDTLAGYGDFRSEIIGSKGVYYSRLQVPEVSEMYAESGHRRFDYVTYLDIRGHRYGFTLQSILYFVDCLLKDEQPFITLEDGLANTRILCAVAESASTGQPIRL